MRRPRRPWGLLVALTPWLAATANAAVITQSVASVRDGKKTTAEHVWSIAGDKFLLEVTGKAGTTRYLFNGRTFYVCGRIDEAQIRAVTSDAKIIESYKSGACQVVPSNFMTRFFLSPLAAVEAVDVSDGLKLTLAITDYQVEAGGAMAARSSCRGHQRRYTIRKTGDAQGFGGGETTTEESLCMRDGVEWRKGLFTEVAKTVLRQPGGATTMKQLRGDMASLGGFAWEGQVKQATKGQDGKARHSEHELTTTDLKTTDVPDSRFKIPAGYRIFSVEGLKLVKLDGPSAKAAAGKSEESLLDLFNSAFFCAIAGRLGCFK